MAGPAEGGGRIAPAVQLTAVHQPAGLGRRLGVGSWKSDALGQVDPVWRHLGPRFEFLSAYTGFDHTSRLGAVDGDDLQDDQVGFDPGVKPT